MTQAYSYRSPVSLLADAAKDMEDQCWDIGMMLLKLMNDTHRQVDPSVRKAINAMAEKLREVSAYHVTARDKEMTWRRTPITTPAVSPLGSTSVARPDTAIVRPTTSLSPAP